MTGDGAGGSFGIWRTLTGGADHPVFEFAVDGTDPALSRVTPRGGAEACWHAVGNAGITATAHVGGWTTIYSTARGMVRLTGSASSWGLRRFAGNDGATRRGSGTDHRTGRRASFGLGYAQWIDQRDTTRISRRVSAPVTGEPVLMVEVTIDGGRAGDVYEERWVAEPRALLIGALMSTNEPPPPGYPFGERVVWSALYGLSSVVRAATNAARIAIAPTLLRPPAHDELRQVVVFRARHPARLSVISAPSWFDRALPDLFVAFVGATNPPDRDRDRDRDRDHGKSWDPAGAVALVDGAIAVAVDDRPVTLYFAVGLADDDAHFDRLLDLVGSATKSTTKATPNATPNAATNTRTGSDPSTRSSAANDPFAASTWAVLADLRLPDRPDLEREAPWHAAALVTAEQHDAYFGRRYIAQGSAYGFIHGLQGAPRDYALYAVPMAYLDQRAARDQLEVMMRMTKPSGSTFYAHTGRGQCTSGGLHAAPTDLPLFFLWSLTEYVWSTGDSAFMDESIPFYPAESQIEATPRQRVRLALEYIEQRVGRGAHGLLRVGSGDWSDPISAMVADRKAFHEHGESGFNTAFAVYVLPRAAALIEGDHPDEAARARSLADELRTAMEACWSGEWYLRGWDGRGAPIGEQHLFLDGQVWALIAQIGSVEQRARLVRAIAARCDDPSPIGATILDRPHPVRLGMLAPGWDCNGGVWATINALLAWGYALHDPVLAWRSLEKQSMAAHARAYPHIWYGIWSGPDAYNAHFGSRSGETFVQPATPMREFPVMNANAHAGPLLALMRTLGIETEPTGIVVRDRAAAAGDWQLDTALGRFSPAGFDPAPPKPNW